MAMIARWSAVSFSLSHTWLSAPSSSASMGSLVSVHSCGQKGCRRLGLTLEYVCGPGLTTSGSSGCVICSMRQLMRRLHTGDPVSRPRTTTLP